MFKRSLVFLCILTSLIAKAQQPFFPPTTYPQGYFGWPVQAEIGIVANFGELRPNHYHMGLDCRTDQKENMPVRAAADGYIAHVKIEPLGFGRCIYINHPNGLTTLYAHLNAFNPALEKYVTDEQYRLKKWSVFLDIPASLFPVHKGDYIANSGNTGGSQGPHVHFEIRDTKTDKVLNPLLFGLPIEDHIPPDVSRLAMFDRSLSTYEQTPRSFALKKVNGIYEPAGGTITAYANEVSFAFTAFDRYTGSGNRNGVYEAFLFDNGEAICGFRLDSISYDETRYLNAHIDYRTRSLGGPFMQHLSRLPGYTNGVYKSNGSDGIIRQTADSLHAIRMEILDAAGNMSVIAFNLILKPKPITAAPPDQNKFVPGYVNVYETDNISFYLPENAIYDFFHFTYKQTPSAAGNIYQLHNATVPVQTYFPVRIKDNFPTTDTGKMVIRRSYGGKDDYRKAVDQNGWYSAKFRDFGFFQLLEDHIPPAVNAPGLREGMNVARLSRIVVSVSDNTEEIGSFNAYLDGNWLRFTNDKGRSFIYTFDEHCPPGAHELRIVVADQVGNTTEKVYHFTR